MNLNLNSREPDFRPLGPVQVLLGFGPEPDLKLCEAKRRRERDREGSGDTHGMPAHTQGCTQITPHLLHVQVTIHIYNEVY